jgi:hypothetical protein
MKTPQDLLETAKLADSLAALNVRSKNLTGNYERKVKEFHAL